MKGTMALERPKHRNQAKQEVNDGRERVPKRRNASEKALLLSIHKLRGPRRQTASQTPIFSLIAAPAALVLPAFAQEAPATPPMTMFCDVLGLSKAV